MEQDKILTPKEVLEIGTYFDGDIVCYGGEYGQQVCRVSERGIEEPITGVVYELYGNSNLNYYRYYVDGISNGHYVCLHENGNIKSVSNMYKGSRHGKFEQWYESGKKKSESIFKYGFCESLMEWDEDGILIKKQTEPAEFDKKMMEKYENYERNKNNK